MRHTSSWRRTNRATSWRASRSRRATRCWDAPRHTKETTTMKPGDSRGHSMKRKDKGRLVDIEMMLTPNLTELGTDVASRAREHTGACIKVLLEIVLSSKAPRSVRIKAAKVLSQYRSLFARWLGVWAPTPRCGMSGKIKGLDDQPNGLREQTPPRSAAR